MTRHSDQDVITLINVFTVQPNHQDALINVLVEATDEVMSKQPGYVSAKLHRSLDGTRVANYARWRSRQDFEVMLQNPEARAHMGEALRLATSEPVLYEVVYSHRGA